MKTADTRWARVSRAGYTTQLYFSAKSRCDAGESSVGRWWRRLESDCDCREVEEQPMLKRALFVLMVSGCAVMATAQQFIYKWTDEQGMVKYSELPPPAGVKYDMVHKPTDTAAVPGAAPRDLTKDQEELARQEAEQKQKEQQKAEETQKQAEDVRAKNCEIAKKNVQVLQGDTQVVKTDAQGNKVALDAGQRAAELQKAQKDADYFCGP
jgi:hypothetical protein